MSKDKTFFSQQLKKIMFEKNLTQKDLAAKLGVGQQMISFWVTASRNPTNNSIKKLADALNVPKSYFLGGEILNSGKEYGDLENKVNLMEEKIERYKTENDLLKKEIDFLKKEIELINLKIEKIK